jgi:hypothetical protein
MKLLSRLFQQQPQASTFLRIWPAVSTEPGPVRQPESPPDAAFQPISEQQQLTDGRALCKRVAVCDGRGRPQREFQVGDEVRLFIEFDVLAEIGVPLVMVELGDGTGRMLQRATVLPTAETAIEKLDAGQRLKIRQVFTLCVPPGVVFLNVGLASLPILPQHALLLYHDDLLAKCARHCFVRGSRLPLSVRLPVAAPPASCRICAEPTARRPTAARAPADCPTLLHVTHWKAGSQWIYAILRSLFPSQIVPPLADNYQVHHWPIESGKVYPTVYATKSELDRAPIPPDARKFVVIRDPRDTLISYYFSLKFSHAVTLDRMAHDRALVHKLDLEEGLLVAIEYWMQAIADIQSSWIASGELIVRYEQLVEDDFGALKEALIDRLGLPVSQQSLRAAVEACRFERLSGGRAQGHEDQGSHYRKGITGDWRNYFTPPVTDAFKKKFGELLIAAGYEQDLNW